PDRLLIAPLPPPDIEGAALELFVADDSHVGHLLELRITDLCLHPFTPSIHLDPKIPLPEALCEPADGFEVPVGDRDEDELDGSQPDGERTRVGLDQVSHEALH